MNPSQFLRMCVFLVAIFGFLATSGWLQTAGLGTSMWFARMMTSCQPAMSTQGSNASRRLTSTEGSATPRRLMSTQDTREDKVVYFTFDDGPSQTYTPLVLDILRKERVPATFFVVGSRANDSPSLIRRIRKEGHELGNHGYSHNYFRDISVGQLEYEVRTTDRTIQRICGVIPYYFRPPGGIMSPDGYKALHRLGHHAVLWTVDSRDHKSVTYREIVENVTKQVRPGSVILFHDGISTTRHTIQALPILIHDLRMQGYRFQVLPIGGATTFKVY